MAKTLEEAVMISKMNVKIVYVKEKESETVPTNGVSFSELVDTRGKIEHISSAITYLTTICFFRN